MKQFGFYVCRWTDRVPNNLYRQTMQQDWNDDSFTSILGYFGDAPLEFAVAQYPYIPVALDNKPRTYTGAMLAIFQHAILADYDYVGILDDDACLTNLEFTKSRVKEILNQNNYGVLGPYGNYRESMVYGTKGKGGMHLHQIKGRPWASEAMHWYSVGMVEEYKEMIYDMYSELKWIGDFALYVLGHVTGRGTYEYYDPGLKHSPSNGALNRPDDLAWFDKTMRNLASDYRTLIKYSIYYPQSSFVHNEFEKAILGVVRNYNNRARKISEITKAMHLDNSIEWLLSVFGDNKT